MLPMSHVIPCGWNMLKLVAKAEAIENPNALHVESGMGLAMLRPGSKVDNLMKDAAKMDM